MLVDKTLAYISEGLPQDKRAEPWRSLHLIDGYEAPDPDPDPGPVPDPDPDPAPDPYPAPAPGPRPQILALTRTRTLTRTRYDAGGALRGLVDALNLARCGTPLREVPSHPYPYSCPYP